MRMKRRSKREKERDEVMGMTMMVTRNPMKGLQGVLEATVPSSFPRIGPSINFYQR